MMSKVICFKIKLLQAAEDHWIWSDDGHGYVSHLVVKTRGDNETFSEMENLFCSEKRGIRIVI